MNAPLFFESAGDERGTPQDFFDKLNKEFHFDIDVAATARNHKCDLYFGEGGVAVDALEEDWGGMTCFLNPPYSVAGAFVQKAREEANKGATVVLLLAVRSDTKWWHKYIWDEKASGNGTFRSGVRLRFIPRRLNFELQVPDDFRAWIKSEMAECDRASATTPEAIKAAEREYTDKLRSMVMVTGLPKMAIERICQDMPDDCLLDAAPFPSCVAIFTAEE